MVIPATFFASSLDVLNGPGATKILDTSLVLAKMSVYVGWGPKLTFTVSDPVTGKPVHVLLEFIRNFEKLEGYYHSTAICRAERGMFHFARLKYRFDDPDGKGRGLITAT
jgi:hypothetical protein